MTAQEGLAEIWSTRERRERRLERERDLLLVSEGFQTANKEKKMGYWLPGIMASRVEVIS